MIIIFTTKIIHALLCLQLLYRGHVVKFDVLTQNEQQTYQRKLFKRKIYLQLKSQLPISLIQCEEHLFQDLETPTGP